MKEMINDLKKKTKKTEEKKKEEEALLPRQKSDRKEKEIYLNRINHWKQHRSGGY